MSVPIIDLIRGFPTDLRELGRIFGPLNLAIRKRGERIFAPDQRFLNPLSTANKQSAQSANPLSSTDSGGGFASIEIAAHSVQHGFGTVAYNSGSITGLLNSTLYYVYGDDPDYEGGAVTYLATTNATNLTNTPGRYYLGKITTDAPAGGGTSGGWGGGGGGGGNQFP